MMGASITIRADGRVETDLLHEAGHRLIRMTMYEGGDALGGVVVARVYEDENPALFNDWAERYEIDLSEPSEDAA